MSNLVYAPSSLKEYFANGTSVPTSFATNTTPTSCSANGESAGLNYGLFFAIVLISIATVTGNVLVIASIIVFRKLRRISSMFIISLASADLIMGGIVMPLSSHYLLGSKWLLGPLICDLWTSIDVLSVTASICTLCAISIDRYMAITKPFEYSKQITRKASRIAIALIWIISGAIAFIPINLGWWKTNEPCDLECYQDTFCCEFLPNKTYAVVSSIISFYAPLTVMVFAYSIVLKIALDKRSAMKNEQGNYKMVNKSGSRVLILSRREYRAVYTMGIIMGTFIICWLPFFIANVVQAFCHRCIPETVFFVLNWLGYANSLFNPLIYCHSKEFRGAFIRLILCSICRDGYQQTCRSSLTTPYKSSRLTNGKTNLLGENPLSQFSSFIGNSVPLKRVTTTSTLLGKSETQDRASSAI